MKTSLYLKKLSISSTFFLTLCLVTIADAQVIEDVIVTAEKRSESLQDISQSVTALTEEELETKNIRWVFLYEKVMPYRGHKI